MSGLRRFIRAFGRRAPAAHAGGVESLRAAAAALDREMTGMREALEHLTSQIGLVQRHVDQLFELRREELDAPSRMEALERVLNVDRIAAHVRQAVARTEIVEDPVPHAVISGLLPPDAYDSVLAAIPAPVFFEDGSAGGRELRVPPALAPTCTIATWAFVTDLVKDVLAPALVGRFGGPLDRHLAALCPSLDRAGGTGLTFAASAGRIVRRWPGSDAPPARTRPWHFLTTVLFLARPGDGEDHGSRLSGAAPEIPFRANSALTVLGPAGAHEYAIIPSTGPAGVVRYSYEFRLGPAPEARRRLMAAMDDTTRRTWQSVP
jgi:hypothetical protein